ncbi:WxL domain-containing protein [Lactiplantibacillus nangangensis]|uniref:WxL domain-containing protein n=1 Tax=Lactiplantibacillus nangangensis TaxID=2559917 RepID=A0ABW1SM41_9LACO|nr:WxL domain-containing protein [Lactiplantibacillus nangangensis]
MKKLITSLTLCGVALMAAPISVKAADSTGFLSTGKTEAEITFTAPDINKIDPINPDNPNEIVTSGVNKGRLTQQDKQVGFVYVTDNLAFGAGKATLSLGQEGRYQGSVQPNKGQVTPNDMDNTSFDWGKNFVVEVADTRSDLAGNWKVKVTGDKLAVPDSNNQSKGIPPIDGAEIIWPTAHKNSNTRLTNSGNGENGAILAEQNVTLALDGQGASNMIFQAPKRGNGAGVTALKFDPNDITLTVPANKARTETYSTTLTWTLETTPPA